MIAFALLFTSAQAATLTAPGPYGSVQAAIDASSPGDTLLLDGGFIDEVLVVPHDLHFQGNATTRTVISPEPATAVGAAGAVYAAPQVALTLQAVDVRGSATRALYGDTDSTLTLLDVQLYDSGTNGDGAGAWVDGQLFATDLFVENTNAAGDGGALWVASDLECTGCRFFGTNASGIGGAIFHGDGDLQLTDTEFVNTLDSGVAGGIVTSSPDAQILRNRSCNVDGFLFGAGGGGSIRATGILGDAGVNALLLVARPGLAWTVDHTTIRNHAYGMITYDVRYLPELLDTATGDTYVPPIDTGSPPGTISVTNSLFVDNDALMFPLYGDPVWLPPTFDHIAFDVVLDPAVAVTNSLSGVSVDFTSQPDVLAGRCAPEAFLPTFDAATIDQGSGIDPDGSPADIGTSGGPDTYVAFHEDLDADGFTVAKECNDEEAASYPGADELCDGVDNDCNGDVDGDAIDLPTWFPDADGDGFGDGQAPAGSGLTQCEQPEPLDDGTGTLVPWAPNGSDCDDASAAVNPGALEDCDLTSDLNCDGSGDAGAGDASQWWPDLDEDGYGDGQAVPVVSCASPGPTYTPTNGDDCNDGSTDIHPAAIDTCNDTDDNCSGDEADAVNAPVWFPDADGDGYPATAGEVRACDAPAGPYIQARADGEVDCDDTEPLATPAGSEVCDGIDNDCSGLADDLTPVPPTWYADDDGDGYGNANPAASVSTDCPAEGYVAEGTDCNDTDPTVSPGAEERCNGRDDDCSGTPDDGPERTLYVDGDGDGWGGEEVITPCPRANLVEQGGDCQDGDAEVNPGAEEVPGNDVDEDCSGAAARPASSPSGEPAGSGCQCSSSSPAGAWLGLFTLALVRLRRRSALAAVGLAACAPEPALDRLPDVKLSFATLTEATAHAPRFALDTPDGPALLQRDSRVTVGADGRLELHHRGARRTPVTATLALEAWGRDRLQPVPDPAAPEALGPRVVLERGPLVEWYLNGPDGIEQGFTLRERPAGRAPLRLSMSVDGLDVRGDADAVVFADPDGVARFRYDKLVVVDRHDQAVPSHMEASCDVICTVELVVDDADASWPLYVDPLLSEFVTDVNAVDAVANLGAAVAVDGDRAAIGAPAGPDSRVFVLERNEGNPDAWGIEQTLLVGEDGFGATVALDDPLLAVGSPDSDMVRVYERSGSWSLVNEFSGTGRFGTALELQTPYLLISAPDNGGGGAIFVSLLRANGLFTEPAGSVTGSPGDELGTSLAVRLPNVIVGAPGYDGGRGAVFVYDGAGVELQRIEGAAGERFGEELAVTSARMAVGVPAAKAVRLFDLDPDATGQFIPSPDPQVEAPPSSQVGFGSSVALLNDSLLVGDRGTTAWAHQYAFVDGTTWLHTQSLPITTGNDGSALSLALNSRTIVAGAPGAGAVGEASVWSRTSDTVVQEALLQLDDGTQSNQGRAVAVDGDLAAVGDETAATTYGGRVDVFANSGTGWALDATFVPGTHSGGDGELGHGVDIDGDAVLAGAPGAGQAFLFTRQPGGWDLQLLVDPDTDGGSRFGEAVAIAGVIVAIGDPSGRGRVQVFEFGSERKTGSVQATITTDPDGYSGGSVVKLGSSVAVEGDLIAAGAPGWDAAGGITDAGAVEVHRHEVAGSSTVMLQRIEGIDADDRCGISVAIDADRLAIGCQNNGPALLPGKALLYRGGIDSYTLEAQISGNTQDNEFGSSVAIDDDRWFVGAKGNSRVRMYQRNAGGEDQWGVRRVFDGPNGSKFGAAMDLDGNTVIIGAPNDGSPGSARIFALDGTIPPTLFDDSFTIDEDAVAVPIALLANDILAGATFTDTDARTTNGPNAATLDRVGDELLFTPDPNVNGIQTFEYTVTGALTYATVTVDVRSINDLPVAVDDAYTASEEVPLNGPSVLANDSDVESPTLSAVLLTGPSDAATFDLQPDGTFTYEGDVDFFGTDSFTYEAVDDDGAASAPATVTITVLDTPEAPVLTDSAWSTDRDTPLVVPAPGLADPAYAALPSGDTAFALADDSLLDGTVLVLGNGGFTYTPDPGFVGVTQFAVRATSPGGTDIATVAIDVLDTNQAPVPQPDAFTLREDTDLVVSLNGVLANDADPEGDPLVALFDVPNQGELVATSPDGSFTYRPPANVHGEAFFVYTATDGVSASAPVVVELTIEPVNDAPVALDDAYVLEGPGPHVVPAEDGLQFNDSDIDGDALATSLLRAPDDAQLTVDADGGFVLTPRLGFEGDVTFAYTLSDGLAASKATVEVTVTGNALPDDTGDTSPISVDTGSPCDDAWYPDRDGDGWADESSEPRTACTVPPGFTDQLGDCDDARADRYPGAPEVQGDGIDQDCDGADADIAPPGACATGAPSGSAFVGVLLLWLRRRQGVA